VLFSEPKIPQLVSTPNSPLTMRSSFSALQRAENSSMASASGRAPACESVSVLFSEPKIPQLRDVDVFIYSPSVFQCSSASRKFLNAIFAASIIFSQTDVSVLFSEPKIPQL